MPNGCEGGGYGGGVGLNYLFLIGMYKHCDNNTLHLNITFNQ